LALKSSLFLFSPSQAPDHKELFKNAEGPEHRKGA